MDWTSAIGPILNTDSFNLVFEQVQVFVVVLICGKFEKSIGIEVVVWYDYMYSVIIHSFKNRQFSFSCLKHLPCLFDIAIIFSRDVIVLYFNNSIMATLLAVFSWFLNKILFWQVVIKSQFGLKHQWITNREKETQLCDKNNRFSFNKKLCSARNNRGGTWLSTEV